MRDDLVTPPTARRLQHAGLLWEPQVGDWCMVLGGEHFGETQSGLWLVMTGLQPTGHLGVVDAAGQWPVTHLLARECVWVPTVGKLKMWLRAQGYRVHTGEIESAGLGGGMRQACRVFARAVPAVPTPVAEGHGVSESEAVAAALLALLEASQAPGGARAGAGGPGGLGDPGGMGNPGGGSGGAGTLAGGAPPGARWGIRALA